MGVDLPEEGSQQVSEVQERHRPQPPDCPARNAPPPRQHYLN